MVSRRVLARAGVQQPHSAALTTRWAPLRRTDVATAVAVNEESVSATCCTLALCSNGQTLSIGLKCMYIGARRYFR